MAPGSEAVRRLLAFIYHSRQNSGVHRRSSDKLQSFLRTTCPQSRKPISFGLMIRAEESCHISNKISVQFNQAQRRVRIFDRNSQNPIIAISITLLGLLGSDHPEYAAIDKAPREQNFIRHEQNIGGIAVGSLGPRDEAEIERKSQTLEEKTVYLIYRPVARSSFNLSRLSLGVSITTVTSGVSIGQFSRRFVFNWTTFF